MISWSNVSLEILTELETTVPASEITAISVVPPPMSTIIFPHGFVMSIPDPIAAATGSGTISTSRAPAWYVASSTAFRSTSVTPDGTQMLILGFRNALLPIAFWIK